MDLSYEFAAPRYVDFTSLQLETEEEDFFLKHNTSREEEERRRRQMQRELEEDEEEDDLDTSTAMSVKAMSWIAERHSLSLTKQKPVQSCLRYLKVPPPAHTGRVVTPKSRGGGGGLGSRKVGSGGRCSGRTSQVRQSLITSSAARRRISMVDTRTQGHRVAPNTRTQDKKGVMEVFRSQAEQIARFEKATPARFRSLPQGVIRPGNKGWSEGKTRPGSTGSSSGHKNRRRSAGQKTVKHTRTQPFSFQEKEEQYCQRKEERARKGNQTPVRAKVAAQPVPRYPDPDRQLPPRKVLPVTRPEPFRLEGGKRLERLTVAWQEGVAREREEARRAKEFRASKAKVLQVPPFVPRSVEREAVVPQAPSLTTDRRAEQREEFEAKRREREAEAEAARARVEEQQRILEAEIVARERKQTVHKARPIPSYRRVELQPGSKVNSPGKERRKGSMAE